MTDQPITLTLSRPDAQCLLEALENVVMRIEQQGVDSTTSRAETLRKRVLQLLNNEPDTTTLPAPHIHLFTYSRISIGDTGFHSGHVRQCLICGISQISILSEPFVDLTPDVLKQTEQRARELLERSEYAITPPVTDSE